MAVSPQPPITKHWDNVCVVCFANPVLQICMFSPTVMSCVPCRSVISASYIKKKNFLHEKFLSWQYHFFHNRIHIRNTENGDDIFCLIRSMCSSPADCAFFSYPKTHLPEKKYTLAWYRIMKRVAKRWTNNTKHLAFKQGPQSTAKDNIWEHLLTLCWKNSV